MPTQTTTDNGSPFLSRLSMSFFEVKQDPLPSLCKSRINRREETIVFSQFDAFIAKSSSEVFFSLLTLYIYGYDITWGKLASEDALSSPQGAHMAPPRHPTVSNS